MSQPKSLVLMKESEATDGKLPDAANLECGKPWSTCLWSLSMQERVWPEAMSYSPINVPSWSLRCSLDKIRLASLTEGDVNACLSFIKRGNETYWIHILFTVILWIHRMASQQQMIQFNWITYLAVTKTFPPMSWILRWPHHGQTWKTSELCTKDDENT